MNATRPPGKIDAGDYSRLDYWYRLFRTVIAGAIVTVLAWIVVQRILPIVVLLIASFVIAYLLIPVVNRLEHGGLPRVLAILAVYLIVFGLIALGVIFLFLPLTTQLTQLLQRLPVYLNPKLGTNGQGQLARFLQQRGIDITSVRAQVIGYVSNAGTTVLGGTLQIVTGVVNTVTNILLILVIAFYFILDGRAMHNRAVRLLPAAYRDRWFFVEATLNKVLGGYIRGQLIVAATVGLAAGVGSQLLGVRYSIVIGLLAFLFELIPMIGPVLGAIPAVLISLFQAPSPVVWVIIYFIVLQQVESNLIVPRVSGHAVGLHPLAALLALLVGLELGGLGGALLAVPLAGVLYVLLMAVYSDATGGSQILVARPRPRTYDFLARQIDRRRGRVGASNPTTSETMAPVVVMNDRIATIQQEKEQLAEKFEADEAEQAAAEQAAPDQPSHERQAPDDPKTPNIEL